ncbi:MAG: multicopper oxidase domain-containing protein [Mycobacteriales bacterium]
MSGRPARGFWPMRDLPVVAWLIAAVVVALADPFGPAPRWLLIHLVLLGAATHSILVWSRYFTDALLHTAPDSLARPRQNRRLVLLNVGVLLVVTGVTSAHWPITVVGGTAIGVAVTWHGAALLRQLRSALPTRFSVTVRYYVAAATLLPVGATLGVALARVPSDPWHQRLLVAHVSTNLLGWVGLTALGTLLTLWPTMLRTRIVAGAERASRRALPVLLLGIALAVSAPLADSSVLTALGWLVYLVGVGLLAPAFVAAARARPPRAFPTWSVGAAMLWLVGCLVVLVGDVVSAGSWSVVDERLTFVTPFLAVGFGAQLLLGAMSYLVPVALGGGPGPVRTANAVLDRAGLARVVGTNAALLVSVLPVSPAVRVLCSAVVLLALASFLPLLVLALRASRAVRTSGTAVPVPTATDSLRLGRQVAVALAVVLVAVLTGAGMDRGGLTWFGTERPVSAGIAATGHTTVAQVEARDMRFYPAQIEVPAGDRLVIQVTNTDAEQVHDLMLDDGSHSPRLSPGDSARVEVGVVGRDITGWCSVAGHRQRGMVLTVIATGAHASPGAPTATTRGHDPVVPELMATPGTDFVAHDPRLPPLQAGRVHRRTLHVQEIEREVAPGIVQRLWTFDGSAPGPTLHGRVGDEFVITLVNDASIGHSIDFHAGVRAPDQVMRTIPPRGQLVYRFTASRAGIWMYHCSTMPMSAHIANGLFGAVVIEPRDLPPVDASFVLVQSELYLGADGGEVDVDKIAAETPDLVVFNGYANQYDHQPLPARVGQRVRIWVLDAGPNRATSFHVVGGQFDTVWAEGAYLLEQRDADDGGSQSLALGVAQGGFAEISFPEVGHYPFLSHVMIDAERGAHGIFQIRP